MLELSCLLKTARIYFNFIKITLVSGNFKFTGINTFKMASALLSASKHSSKTNS